MNDDLNNVIDQEFNILDEQGENQDEQIHRIAEEAREEAASAPVEPTPTPEAPEAPTPEAPAAEEEGGFNPLGAVEAFKNLTGVDPVKTTMGLVNPTAGIAENAANLAKTALGAIGIDASPITDVAADAGKVIPGAAMGALESSMNALEMIGDVAQSLPGLLNQDWKPAAKDDVFQFGPESKYEWANWNLGKDEYGAKTGIGKLTQGFLEFGILMAGTGGFGTAAKGAGALKAGLKGASSGIAADLIDATNGEGNLSNLIRENAPEAYPAWLTALAVEDDDNPLVAIGKTALEGAVMGFASDAVGAYLSGARTAKKALREGATEAEAADAAANAAAKVANEIERSQNGGRTIQEAVTAMQRSMDTGLPHNHSGFTGYRKLLDEAGDYVASAGDSIQKENFMRLYKQAAAGIPVSIDDVKLLMPEKFIPGPRSFTEMKITGLDDAVRTLENGAEGFTINPLTGETPPDGIMVAIDGTRALDKFDENSVAEWMTENYDILTREDAFLGGWIENGKPIIEISRRVEDPYEAVFLGKIYDQFGIFNMANEKYMPTGGLDQLKLTKGIHERPMTSSPPLDPKPISQVEANATALWPGNHAEPIMTEAKFKKVAEGTGEVGEQVVRDVINEATVPLADLSRVVGKSREELAAEARKFIQEVTGASGEIDFDKIRNGMTARDQYGMPLLGDDQLVGVIQLMKDTSRRITESARMITQKYEAGMDISDEFDRLVQRQKALMKIHKETVSFQGRSLQNNKLLLEDMEINNPLPAPDPKKAQRDLEKASANLDKISEGLKSADPNARQKAVQQAQQLELANGDPAKMVSITRSIADGITNQALGNMYNSLLSGPETHMVNTISSLIMSAYRPLAMFVGSGFKEGKQAFAAFHGINQTIADAWQLSTDAYKRARGGAQVEKTGQVIRQGAEELKLHQEFAEQSGNQFVKMVVGFEDMLFSLKNNPVLSWSGPLMEAEDAFSSAIASRFEFNMNMMRKAIDTADGDKIDDVFKSLLQTEKLRYFDEAGNIADPDLIRIGDEVTFRTKLEGRAAEFAALVNNAPYLRPFFPFVKTGHNIMVFTAESTPLAPFTREWQAVMAGTDESAKAILKGRAATGTFVMLSAALAAGSGRLTGAGPSDPREREQWLMNHQPRSILVGDKWVSYERWEPFASVMQAAADVTWGIQKGLVDESKAAHLVSYMTYAFAQNFTDKSVFSGLDPLSRLLKPGADPMGVAMVPAEVLNNFFPMSSARRALANSMNGHRKWFDNRFSQLLDQATGGLLPQGATQYDWLDGAPVTSGNSGLYNALSPINVHKRKSDIVRDTLEDLGFKSNVISKTLDGEKMTAQERSELSRLMGSGALYKELEKLIKHRGYDKFGKELRKARAADPDVFTPGGQLGLDREQSAYIEIKEVIIRHRDEALAAVRSKDSPISARAERRRARKDEAGRRTAQDLQNFYKN